MANEKTLKSIPKPVLPYAMGALDETIRSTPEAERPEGSPLPVTILLSLAWRRKWAGLSEPLRT